MTEQEIIEYLKENKNEGKILSFMPEEVRKWCEINKKELLVWQSNSWYKFDADNICTDDAVTLPDDYKVKEESKGEWVEFNVNSKGEITVNIDDDNEPTVFYWNEWGVVLNYSRNSRNKAKYVAFGGWQYEDSKRWYLAPAVKLQDGEMWNSYVIEESGEATPVIPVKIRFWKEYK